MPDLIETGGPGWPALAAAHGDPVLRHAVEPERVTRAWRLDSAVVVLRPGGWPGEPEAPSPSLLAVGERGDLARLAAHLTDVAPRAWRSILPAGSLDAPEVVVPPGWRPATPRTWHWMWTTSVPAPVSTQGPHRHPVTEVGRTEFDELLDAVSPESEARRHGRVHELVGVRDEDGGGRLVAGGALVRRHDGTGHLTGIATLPGHEGRGLGAAVTRALIERAVAGASGVASLGVYAENARAIALYERLGLVRAQTFVSGLVGGAEDR